jgi:protein-S-isoprenylcysteine O-methyltransferase Ste14
MVVYKRLRFGRHSGVIPRQQFERRLWLLLLPTVAASLVLPVVAATTRIPGFTPPAWIHSLDAVRWVALVVGVLCYLGSLVCWSSLGRSWSLGVVPKQTSELVTGGVYGWVRHPIYSLNMGLMLATALITATVPMAVVAVAHLVAMNLKAAHEERHLTGHFGTAYTEYCRRVGRFFPRLAW